MLLRDNSQILCSSNLFQRLALLNHPLHVMHEYLGHPFIPLWVSLPTASIRFAHSSETTLEDAEMLCSKLVTRALKSVARVSSPTFDTMYARNLSAGLQQILQDAGK